MGWGSLLSGILPTCATLKGEVISNELNECLLNKDYDGFWKNLAQQAW